MVDVSVIVPTLNAGSRLEGLLSALEKQSVKPLEILVVDSESTDNTVDIARNHEGVVVKTVARSSFNHGTTRHEALLDTKAPFVCFMTDDAIPADEHFIENLLKPFSDQAVALISGRQLPKSDARRFEQLVREFNYGPVSNIRASEDIDALGIKSFFASDACSMYRRSAYLSVGGFSHVNTNEDMLIASHFLHSGYKVGYAADACVFHSHSFTPKQQFNRNREVGRFLESHATELDCGSEVGEGASLAKAVLIRLAREGNITELVAFCIDCIARLMGNRCGRADIRNKEE